MKRGEDKAVYCADCGLIIGWMREDRVDWNEDYGGFLNDECYCRDCLKAYLEEDEDAG